LGFKTSCKLQLFLKLPFFFNSSSLRPYKKIVYEVNSNGIHLSLLGTTLFHELDPSRKSFLYLPFKLIFQKTENKKNEMRIAKILTQTTTIKIMRVRSYTITDKQF